MATELALLEGGHNVLASPFRVREASVCCSSCAFVLNLSPGYTDFLQLIYPCTMQHEIDYGKARYLPVLVTVQELQEQI